MPRQLTRRRSRAADVDEVPATRRRSAPEPEEAEEEEQPGRRRSSRAVDAGDSRPARSSRRRADEGDGDAERPRPGRKRENKAKPGGASLGSGLDAYRSQRSQNYGKDQLIIRDKPVLVKFLEPAMFTTFREHWLNELPKGVKKSHTCYKAGDPFCDEGISTRLKTLFNVVDMADGEVKYLEAGPALADAIADFIWDEEDPEDNDPDGPLDREDVYFSIKRKKKANDLYDFTVKPVDERDLDRYNTEPLTGEELDDALDNLFDDSVIQYTSIEDMEKLIDSLDDE
jgi:hypothetical protein